MSHKTIEKTDNFRVVTFDPAPTAVDMQELYEKGWTLHMGPFAVQAGKFHTAMFFRAVVPSAVVEVPAQRNVCVVQDKKTKYYSVVDAHSDEVISDNWPTFGSAAASAEQAGFAVL